MSVVAAAHVAVLITLIGGDVLSQRRVAPAPDIPMITAEIVTVVHSEWDVVPVPDLQLRQVPVDSGTIQIVRFEDSEQGDISGVIAPESAPHLTGSQLTDTAAFAKRAGLAPGHPATVVLNIEVLVDGSVGTVEVVRSYGDVAVDAAAVEYARSLRWVPGTFHLQARSVRIRFPVTLVRAS
jgi:TonB family protein